MLAWIEARRQPPEPEACAILLDEACNARFKPCGHKGSRQALEQWFAKKKNCHLCRQPVRGIEDCDVLPALDGAS